MIILNKRADSITSEMGEAIKLLTDAKIKTIVLAKGNFLSLTLWRLEDIVTNEFNISKPVYDKSLTVVSTYDFTVDYVLIMSLRDKMYACKIINGSVYVSDEINGSDLDCVYVLSDEESFKLLSNVIEVNKIAFELLFEQLSSDDFKGELPICSDVERNGDEIILKMDVKKDTDQTYTDYFELKVAQNYEFDDIRNLSVTISKSPKGFDGYLLSDVEGYFQDLGIVKNNIYDIYNYVISKYLYDLGIDSKETLHKLADVEFTNPVLKIN